MVNILGATIEPRTFTNTTLSNIVRKVLSEEGFDSKHRYIQDTIGTITSAIQKAGETNLAFLQRLAKSKNFKFYQTALPDGTAMIHFHKQGFERVDEQDVEVDAETPDPKSGESGRVNGNFAPTSGYVFYRYNLDTDVTNLSFPVINEVKRWSIRNNSPGTPKKAQALGINLLTGKVLDDTEIDQSDLESQSLSNKTLFVRRAEDGKNYRLVQKLPIDFGNTDQKEGNSLAADALESAQESVIEMKMDIVGDPRIEVGTLWRFVGFAKYDGNYLLEEIVDTFSNSDGYVNDLTWSTDGVQGKTETYEPTGRERKDPGEKLFVRREVDGRAFSILERTDEYGDQD
jgi:hypothetical protein